MFNIRQALKLCLLTHIKPDQPLNEYLKFVIQAVAGGVTMVQLREKGTDLIEVKEKALALQQVLRPLGVPLIINDFVELAAEINADGVHIGQEDMSPAQARNILGRDKIIGLSIESFNDLELSNQSDDLNYVTASAVYQSKTKPYCKTLWGIQGLSDIVKLSRHPVTAIGGIKLNNIKEIERAGATGVAVIGAIHDEPDPYLASRYLREHFDQSLHSKLTWKMR